MLAAILLAARNVIPALGYVAGLDAGAPDLEERVEDGKKQFAGAELPHRTLGIVGLGAIGSLVADTAIKIGMKVIGFDPEITVDAAWRLPSSVRRANSIEELLKQSDFVTLHVPLLAVTRHLMDEAAPGSDEAGCGAAQFRARRRSSMRRRVDCVAAVAAAQVLPLRFSERSALREPGVTALPHLGASTDEAEENCAVMVVDQVREYLEHGSDRQFRQLSRCGHAARIAVPGGHRQCQRPQHAGADFDDDGDSDSTSTTW